MLVKYNSNNTVPKKLPISINPNNKILPNDGSKGLSGNLPTPIKALKTSLTTEKDLISKHHCAHKSKT